MSYGAVCWRAIGEILQSFSLLFVVFPMAASFVLTQCILAWDEFQRIMGMEQSKPSLLHSSIHSRDWERSRWRRSIKILRQAENQTTERRKKEGIREVRKWLISPRPPFVQANGGDEIRPDINNSPLPVDRTPLPSMPRREAFNYS